MATNLSALQRFQLKTQATEFQNEFNKFVIENERQKKLTKINQGIAEGASERNFSRYFERFNVRFDRKGLETSGIRDQAADRTLTDQDRNQAALTRGFNSQTNALTRQFNVQNKAHTQQQQNLQSYGASVGVDLATQLGNRT